MSPCTSRGITSTLVVVLALAAAARADPAPPPDPHETSPYHVEPVATGAVLAGVGALWTLPYFIASPTAPPPACDPCDANLLNAFDRSALGLHDARWRWAGNLLLVTPAASFLLLDVLDVGARRWRAWLTDFVVIVEAMVIDGAIEELFRRAVRRPRPYLYEPGVYPEDRRSAEASFSFYSGHTSAMFVMSVGLAYTWTLRHPGSRWRWLVWSGLLAVASVLPVARVLSGDHFPTDVIVGAVVGSSMGLFIPTLHRRRAPLPVALAPMYEGGAVGLSLTGRF